MGTPEREEREKRRKEMFETIMMEKFPKLMSDTKPQIQEAQRTLSRVNAKNKTKQKHQKTKNTLHHTQKPLKTKHQSSPAKQNKTKTIPQHIIFKLQKIKD